MAKHVIIGSGINSLVAAALLARKGHKVVVLEREDRLGGCMMTADVTLPGFRHDVMATTFALFLTSPAHAELAEELAKHGFELCHTPHPTGVLRPGGQAAVLTTDRAANVKAFNALSPGAGDRHAQDVGAIEADSAFLFALLGSELWSWNTVKLMFREWRKRGLNGLKAWFGRALEPARNWLEDSYESPELQALYAPWVLHVGLNPESTYSGQIGKVMSFAIEAAGAPIAKGGAARAVEAFRSLIESHGGEVRAATEVDEILVSNGKVSGVRTASGETITADRVLASVAPSQLYTRLLKGNAFDEERESARKYRYGRGNFQLHYALKEAPKWKTDGLNQVALLHLTDGIDAVSKSSNEAERSMLPETPTICVGQPHALDPSRCPEGNAILWIQVPDAPNVPKGDAAGKISTNGQWDEATREAFADRLEEILADHIVNFADIKMARRAFSPADLEALNANLIGGDPYGGQCTLDQFFIFRPFATTRNANTKIKNLYHIGASTFPGPGLSGTSGYNTAKRLGA